MTPVSGIAAPFKPDMGLEEARALLRTMVDAGATCPCCTQNAKVYRRKINSTMARCLLTLYRHGAKNGFVHAPSLPGDTHEVSQLSWWALVAELQEPREDGGRAGWWRLTDLGIEFTEGLCPVPKYARIYDGRCLGWTGDPVTIQDCLGSRFNYAELMQQT